MADDIILTVRVRDMARGQFERLDRQLDNTRRSLRQVGSSGNDTSQRMQRLDQSLGAVQGRMRRLQQTGTMTTREMQHMRGSLTSLNRELTNAARSGEITRDQYTRLRNEADRTRLTFDRLSRDINLHRTVTRNTTTDTDRLRMAQERLRLAWVRADQTAQRLTQNDARMALQRTVLAQRQLTDSARLAQGDQRLTLQRSAFVHRQLVDGERLVQSDQRVTLRRAALAQRQLVDGERLRQGETRLMQGEQRLAMMRQRLNGATKTASTNGTVLGKVFGNMHSKLLGVAVVLGASLLPTIGALAPMLAGVGAMAGVAALAFSGLSAPAKFLSKDQKDFLKALKPVTNEFKALRKSAQEAVLPQLTKSFGDVRKAVKSLNPVITIAGDAFGRLVGKIAKGISSKDFMGPFVKNVKMGTDWLGKFLGSFGKFSKAFFEFGTKSQPSLDAWQDLLGGFMDRGLPGMFTSMESGIKGASLYLKGLSSLINDGLLPGLGKIIGKFMEAFGPSLGSILRETGRYFLEIAGSVGDLFASLAPVANVLGNVAAGLIDISRISFGAFADTMKEIGGGLLKTVVESFSGDQVSNFSGALTSLSTWVQDNEGAIRDAFTKIGQSAILMTVGFVEAVPVVLRAMKMMAEGVLTSLDIIVSGAAAALGWLPGVGGDLEKANTDFDNFSSSVRGSFDTAIAASDDFATRAKENLSRASLSLNVDTAERNIADLKEKLQDPELTKERKAKLSADLTDAKQKLAEAQAKLSAFDGKRADAKLSANASQFATAISWANRTNPRAKTVSIGANTSKFWSSVGGVVGRVLGTSYVDVAYRKVDSSLTTHGFAMGGRVRRFADGGDASGPVSGPGTGMSDSVPAMLSNGEYVIRASSVKKYGQGYMDALNSGTAAVKLASGGMASGGTTAKQRAAAAKKKAAAAAAAEKAARNAAVGDLTISHFGKMAGYKNDEMRTSLAKPAALGDLVNSLNQWRTTILKATHGGVEKSLLKSLDKAGKRLLSYDKSLSKVETSLANAKTKLDDLKTAAASLRDSVTSGVMSATDITRNTSSDKTLTVADLMTTMTQGRDQSTAFAQSLKDLKSKGVSKDIINQIAQAGISGGGLQTAGTLLSASSSEITSLNTMQGQINAAAKSAGQTASDAMYAAGIKAADGLVKGLTKKKTDIENAMMNIAKSMEKAIKKALKIKSPSKVMQEVGHYTAEGFAVGVQKNQRVDSAWESMLTTSNGISSSSSGASSGMQQPIQIYVGGKFLDEIILDSNRRTVRTRGGNVQAVFGRRNG